MEMIGILSDVAEMEGILSAQHEPEPEEEEPIQHEPVIVK